MTKESIRDAAQMLRAGRRAEAAEICRKLLETNPNHLEALMLSGWIQLQSGRFDDAEQAFAKALTADPANKVAASGRIAALQQLGRRSDALAVADHVIRQHLDDPVTWNNRGNLLLEIGRQAEALESYTRAIQIDSRYPEAWHNRGVAFLSVDDYSAAEADFTRALLLKSDYVQALEHRGIARAKQGAARAKDAIEDLERVVSIGAAGPETTLLLARNYSAALRRDDALACCNRILATAPNHIAALIERGFLFLAAGQFAAAVDDFDRVITGDPHHPAGWKGRGIALARLNHDDDALVSLTEALRLDPTDALILYNHASLLSAKKKYQEAAADLELLLRQDADFPLARGLLLNARLHLCDWRDLDKSRAEITKALEAGKRAIHPFTHLVISDSPAEQLTCARIHTTQAYPPAAEPIYRGETYRHKKVRVAYVSGDFFQHAVPFLIAGVLENHNRAEFEVYGLSYGANDHSEMRQRLESACDHFVDAPERSDRNIAGLLREMEIDIAVDLKVHAGGARPGIFAHRGAPIQVNYLGYPGTSGADYIDYLIADRVIIPPDERQFYSERTVYLPDTYQANDSRRQISTDHFTRDDAGLPEDAFVFCCFNANHKILPETFAIWMRILENAPNSVLWLLDDHVIAARNLRREAQNRGIAPERILFAKHERPVRHLARLRLADLSLDTLPYGAHTTSSDALWAGVPVLTRAGSTFAGRVSASLLTAIGMPELITFTDSEYVSLACRLAQSPSELEHIRTKLQQNRAIEPLFDTTRMSRNLEAAYLEMCNRRRRGDEPASFSVVATNG